MRASHQFVRTTTVINNGACLTVITVQSLIARDATIFRANHPDNHAISAIGRSNER
jgi:hypothetical protein